MPGLVVAWASHAATRYACENWHYARVLPTGKLVKIGVWEDGTFVGAVVFSRGASPWLGKAYGLDHTEVCELTRVAFREHREPISRSLPVVLRMLRQANPGLRLVVSFADPDKGHHGGLYQATNWIYTGTSNDVVEHFIGGRWRHTRGAYWTSRANSGIPQRVSPGKHRYLFPLDRVMRRAILPRALPFPKPAAVAEGDSRLPAEGGVRPVPAASPDID